MIVIFGASGDLTHRKLVPALVNLAKDEYLPESFAIVGASRTKYSDEEFRNGLWESVKKYSRRGIEPEVWQKFAKNIFYQPTDGTDGASFEALSKRLQEIGKQRGGELRPLYYLATAPEFFGKISENLRAHGLAKNAKIIVEKPFGHDLNSAKILNNELKAHFNEDQIFRIDHYLGKETVQNILVFRFANGIFEPVWNSKFVDHIQITWGEDIGVGTRGAYFDQNGILRDMVQNHLLQILALLCIEPPTTLNNPDAIRDEKVKVLSAIKRLSPSEVTKKVARAQYSRGGEAPGYLEEKGVSQGSLTETAIAMQLEIDNWRWAGVPIYIRAGKRLPKKITEIAVFFKRPPGALFAGQFDGKEFPYNVLSIQVQPKEGINLRVNSKQPGPRMRVSPVDMDFSYAQSFNVPSPEAYERLLLDAMKGNQTLFTRSDEIEQAWEILDPITRAWAAGEAEVPLHLYRSGTWGPLAFNDIVKQNGHSWLSYETDS